MRLWPLRRPAAENRNYTEQRIRDAIEATTGTGDADASGTAAVQAAAGAWGRGLALATVAPATSTTAALTPAVLYAIGRGLLLAGNVVFAMAAVNGRLRLYQACDYDVTGGADPDSWRYRLTLPGPTTDTVRRLGAESVLHFRINDDGRHRGQSPIACAGLSSALLANIERGLAREAKAPSGYVIPSAASEGMDDADFNELREDLGKLKGGTRLVPSQGPRAGDPQSRPADQDWKPRRLGIDPPESLVDLRSGAAIAVFGAAGVPPTMFTDASDRNNEALRLFMFGTLRPVVELILEELRHKLEVEVELSLSKLAAADTQARARSFKALRDGGASLPDAARETGFTLTTTTPAQE